MKRLTYVVILLLSFILSSVFLLNLQNTLAQGPQHGNLLFSVLQNAYGSRQGDFRWNSDADLNKDGIIDLLDLVLFCHVDDVPLILNVSTNQENPDMDANGGFVIFSMTVRNADRCVLSYMYVYFGNASEWVNETMPKNGEDYSGTIDTNSMPGMDNISEGRDTRTYFKIYAINGFNSTVTAVHSFVNWLDP